MKTIPVQIMKLALLPSLLTVLSIGACAVAPSQVEPPVPPKISEDPRQAARHLAQPAALTAELTALTEGDIDARVARLKRKVLNDLVYVEGGSFKMGNSTRPFSPTKYYYVRGSSGWPAHNVTLTSYSIARYKTTYAEYDVFADATGRPRAGMEMLPGWEALPVGQHRHPVVPAGMRWQQAKDYCVWLGEQTGVPFDLPTEAQWEYAARSRGQNFVWATDNGHIEKGRNVASAQQREFLRPAVYTDPQDPGIVVRALLLPVGLFPPNPLGLYDMNANGWEWMQDWYEYGWYEKSPEHDPKGPPTGTMRSVRGYADGDYVFDLNLIRFQGDPMLAGKYTLAGVFGPVLHGTASLRCAVNLDRPAFLNK